MAPWPKGLLRRVAALPAAFAVLAALGSASPAALANERPLRIVLSSTSFAWLPLYVADGAGYFKDEKVEVEISNVKDGPAVVAALLSNDAEIGGIGANSVFASRGRGQPIRLVAPLNSEFTSVIFARKDALARKGITPQSPIEAKIEAMKGMKVGVIAINTGAHQVLRFLMQRYGKADLDRVSEVLPVGDAPATLAAMTRGIIEVTAFSPPVSTRAVNDGYAVVLLDPIRGDIPETRGMVFTALAASDATIAKRRTDFKAFVRALDRANRLIYADQKRAGQAARKHLASMPADLFEPAMATMVPATPKSPEVSIAGLRTYYELLRFGGEKYAQGPFDFEAATANDLVREAMSERK